MEKCKYNGKSLKCVVERIQLIKNTILKKFNPSNLLQKI